MAKSAVRYVCSNCGAASASWAGRCYQCGEWNTLQEEVMLEPTPIKKSGQRLSAESVVRLASTDTQKRLPTGLGEVDSVLGGGVVAGSVSLIAGEPGIGKSTLLL